MMFNNISLYNPDFVIDCSTVKESRNIYDIVRSNGIVRMYSYALLYRLNLLQFEILKIGESCPSPGPSTAKAVAERLGRQLAWLPGWENPQPKSSHGADFSINLQEEIRLGNLSSDLYDKNKIIVAVWNLDIRAPNANTFVTSDSDITKWVEGHLAMQYKQSHDMQLPILNYKDPTQNRAYRECTVNIAHFNSMFNT